MQINSPDDLKKLDQVQLIQLCDELRHFIIDNVSVYGGHFGASLGVVELTVALHYVFNTPYDQLVWDVGHQAYGHKILTGRRDNFPSNRKYKGLSGFPKRSESEYDTFGVGHSSTSISAALGMALGARRAGEQRRCVAVIGDGAMTAGLAFEAMNHAGSLDTDLLVVLNDNDMSISENVGALSNYLAKLLTGRVYATIKGAGKKVLERMPTMWELARRSEEHLKGMVLPGTLFEELGFNYIGPIDGHDLPTLVTTLSRLRVARGPQFLHVVTRKGKGYAPAEADPIKWHGPGPFDPGTGTIFKEKPGTPTYTQVFGEWLCDEAAFDARVVGITPAMREGSGLVEFSKRYPDRYYDVGIAEQHAITLAAGMACEGLRPVVAIYSSFLQRGYDQLIHDVALQDLPVTFAIDRAGLVGSDGATHQGAFDYSFLRCIPNMHVLAPADEDECRQMLHTAVALGRPAAVRYPRGRGPGVAVQVELSVLPTGKAQVRREGRSGLVLLAFGTLVAAAERVGEELDATVVNMRWVKPLDEELVLRLAQRYTALVTLEENAVAGGAGAAVLECLQAAGFLRPTLALGLPDRYIDHASPAESLVEAGLDLAAVRQRVTSWWQGLPRQGGGESTLRALP
jgi:1-deoxy-D-xylulose-5-phosphate synthase